MNSENVQGNRVGMFFGQLRFQRGLMFGVIIVAALLAFEIFNFSTTDYALTDLLGDLSFLGVHWSTILSIAFCGIDFAGIARLFTPEDGQDEPGEVWYLFGAWLLAATMNAMLTWWGVSLAVINHQTLGNAVIERDMLLRVVPIFVAVLVWLIRVLIIGTFSVAGDRLFSQGDVRYPQTQRPYQQPYSSIPASSASPRPLGSRMPAPRPISAAPAPSPLPAAMSSGTRRPMHKPAAEPVEQEPAEPNFGRSESPAPSYRPETGHIRPEPTYHPLSMSAPNNQKSNSTGGSKSSRTNSRQLR